ncbi:MAG: DUF4468 domain-containing protein [Bacteroidales bacterium]|nr:DUF4468 domain-containing protein [Bacteroidales bacterium]
MNKVVILIVLMAYLKIHSQEYKEINVPIDSSTKLITYSKVIEVAGANKDSLYRKGRQWYFYYFKNPSGVIREENKSEYKITGKHQIRILNPPDKKGIQSMKGIVQYTIITQFKDNKTKITLTDFNLKETSYFPLERWLDKSSVYFTPKNYFYLEQIDKEMKSLIDNYEQYMKKKENKKTDNW